MRRQLAAQQINDSQQISLTTHHQIMRESSRSNNFHKARPEGLLPSNPYSERR